MEAERARELQASEKSISEKVHDFYHKMFPGAACPITGASSEELMTSACPCASQPQPDDAASCSSSPSAERKAKYKHPHTYDVYGRRQLDENQVREGINPHAYDVYGRTLPDENQVRGGINPANRMPAHANQQPAPGQKEALSTHRQRSSIPKAGSDGTWLYPSPQMFYNSLVRKNAGGDFTEEDMGVTVAWHNTVNEQTWSRLLRWEHLYGQMYPDCSREGPRLLRFRARPKDLAPKAYLKKVLGYGVPFDRHDWTVDRGGREMRYVIDYYCYGGRERPIVVDVRPALDSPSAFLLRARMMLRELVGEGPSLAQADALRTADSRTGESEE